jgi:hypothetical protein
MYIFKLLLQIRNCLFTKKEIKIFLQKNNLAITCPDRFGKGAKTLRKSFAFFFKTFLPQLVPPKAGDSQFFCLAIFLPRRREGVFLENKSGKEKCFAFLILQNQLFN